MQYPVDVDQVIHASDLAAGIEYIRVHYKEYAREINAAFYTGFLMGICETKNDYKSLTTTDRINAMAMATKIAQEFYS